MLDEGFAWLTQNAVGRTVLLFVAVYVTVLETMTRMRAVLGRPLLVR